MTDSRSVRARELSGLPFISDTMTVAIVTDSLACARAVDVTRTLHPEPFRSQVTEVLLIAVGTTRYWVWDPTRNGSYQQNHILDERFAHLVTLAM
ncbi:MAG: hypothetical protein MUF21_15205 [Gemmatimonadaceae bacterium]|jgi:hypothetical protein|nr:hypothetical protein [Gemmatimonadaceae bacterium]